MPNPAGFRPWHAALAGLLALVFVWLALPHDTWRSGFSWRGQQGDYYNLLVDGFQAGHLHMNLPVHPDRFSPDPAVRDRAPRALDAGLYNGRYYLYYGVVPAVLVLWPYSALTGHDLSLNLVTTGFTLAGFLVSLAWYFRLRRTYFPRAGAVTDFAAILMLAFGPATTFLVRRSLFYELPLAAGYTFLCLFVYALTRALLTPGRAGRWLAVASAALGFAAGCHPNHALLTVLLALATAWLLRRHRAEGLSPLRLAAAAVLPAAMLGAALAAYNYARFGSPLNFGFDYGENVFFTTQDRLLGADFLWPNFKWYYLSPPTFQPYFPFLYPIAASFRPPGYHGAEAMQGQFVFFVSALLILGAAAWTLRRTRPDPIIRVLVLVLLAMSAIAALVLMSFGIRANRYMVDFQFPLALLVVLGLAALGQASAGRARRWLVGLGLSLAILTGLNNTAAAIQQFDDFRNTRPREFAFWSALNPSWETWARLGLVQTGRLVMQVKFPAVSGPVGQPLVTTGGPGYSDTVYALLHPGAHLEFQVDHHGYGGPRSRVLSYEPGKTYKLEIELGSFLPPLNDRLLRNTDPATARTLKSRARVWLDGEPVINHPLSFYEAAPWDRQIGTNLVTHNPYATRFTGQIESVDWQPSALPESQPPSSAVLSLNVTIPDPMPANSQPLLASGVSGAGNLLFLRPTNEGQWLIQVDEWGYGLASATTPFSLAPGLHRLDLLIGPRLAKDPVLGGAALPPHLQSLERSLVVWLDGREVGRVALDAHLDTYREVQIGTNHQGFSSATAEFQAEIEVRPFNPDASREVIARLTPAP